jgi:hypothetical protein
MAFYQSPKPPRPQCEPSGLKGQGGIVLLLLPDLCLMALFTTHSLPRTGLATYHVVFPRTAMHQHQGPRGVAEGGAPKSVACLLAPQGVLASRCIAALAHMDSSGRVSWAGSSQCVAAGARYRPLLIAAQLSSPWCLTCSRSCTSTACWA